MVSAPPSPLQRRRSSSPSSAALLIGLSGLGLLAAVLMAFELQKNTVYFMTPAEAVAKAPQLERQGRPIRIGGMVKVGSLHHTGTNLTSTFTLWDLHDAQIQVTYVGLLPDMFKEGSGVVVEGSLHDQGQTLAASKLMVKHSEEYTQPDHADSINSQLLEASLFKTSEPSEALSAPSP